MTETTDEKFEGEYKDDDGNEFVCHIEDETTYRLVYPDYTAYIDADEFHGSSVEGFVMPTDGRVLP